MDKISELFLAALRASLKGEALTWDEEVTGEEWGKLISLAREHSVLPLFYDGIYRCNAFQKTGMAYAAQLKGMSIQSAFLQIQKTQSFLEVYRKLGDEGLRPVVVKGLVCRSLYPNPDLRSSNDEDVYVPATEYGRYHELLTSYGYELRGDEEADGEAEYVNQREGLMIEVLRDLMDAELGVLMDMNVLFDGAFERTIELEIEGCKIRTLCHTDHLLFLILHAFKHFVTGGFGIRQVLDMIIYSETYGAEIDWESVLERCRMFRAEQFALALFEIGYKYFDFDYEKAYFSSELRMEVDSMPLLLDLLDAGIYGASSLSRKHSAGITMNTLQAQHEGKKSSGMLASLFPKASALEERFPYLKKKSWLLPVAWVQRIWGYAVETRGNKEGNNAAESIKIGNERVELMKKYGILK